MAVNTILMDFSVEAGQVQKQTQIASLSGKIEQVLKDYLSNLRQVFASDDLDAKVGNLRIYHSDNGAITTVRIFPNGIITINVEYYREESTEPLLTYEKGKEIEQEIFKRAQSSIIRSQVFVPIKRGKFDRYFPTSDERLLEYDIDDLVFEQRTQYQKVQIVHSKSLGNMLVLDDLQNISEADLIYTETLMARGREDYKGKEIVILGGGDGALLYELLKEQPKNVIMLEIDDVVMQACAKHMRSVCGDVLDSRKGPNYQIIVGDCMQALDVFIEEGRKFDYVFGDLTDIPIATKDDVSANKVWDFILKILRLSFKILKEDGKFMTHGNGTSCEESLKKYEEQLHKLEPPVSISKSTAFVPSFLEDWVFYQIQFAAENGQSDRSAK